MGGIRAIVAALGCLLLFACAQETTTPSGYEAQTTDNQSALAAEYQDFALMLGELGHEEEATLMRHKAQAAQQHEPVMLNEPTNQNMTESQQILQKLLADNARLVVAQTAARAQILYDCQTLRSLPVSLRADCATEFEEALAELQTVQVSLEPRHYHSLHFAPKQVKLSAAAKQQLKHITSQLLALGNYRLIITGHATSTLNDEADWELAYQRAKQVMEALADSGVDEGRMQAVSLGSNAPLDTENAHKAEPNDRVEVRIVVDAAE